MKREQPDDRGEIALTSADILWLNHANAGGASHIERVLLSIGSAKSEMVRHTRSLPQTNSEVPVQERGYTRREYFKPDSVAFGTPFCCTNILNVVPMSAGLSNV